MAGPWVLSSDRRVIRDRRDEWNMQVGAVNYVAVPLRRGPRAAGGTGHRRRVDVAAQQCSEIFDLAAGLNEIDVAGSMPFLRNT